MAKKHYKRESTTFTIEGEEFEGEYVIEGDVITVFYQEEYKKTQLGGSKNHPKTLARVLLGELVRQSKK